MKASKVFLVLAALVISVISTSSSHADTRRKKVEFIAGVANQCVDLDPQCHAFEKCLGMTLTACCMEAGGTIRREEGGYNCYGDKTVKARFDACTKNDLEFCSQLLEGQ